VSNYIWATIIARLRGNPQKSSPWRKGVPLNNVSRTVRILISSPGDVNAERDGAKRVVEGLRRLYPGIDLLAVLWEELALPATASFQESIDYLLEREPVDIAVFIIWSRLGSPLGAAVTRDDGKPYRSGTEREFDLMLTAFQQSGCKRPVMLAYVRDDDAKFRELLTSCATEDLEDLISQRKLAESFVREQFHDDQGHNVRAYQTYREPSAFREQLKGHLRRALDDLLRVEKTVTWSEDPYRGLNTFDVEHAPIFYGRDEETCDVLQRLRDQRRSGCAFAVIVAASGAGKSSLARAGVAASLIHGTSEEDEVTWHSCALMPALCSQDLQYGLVEQLANVNPEISSTAEVTARIANGLKENPTLTVEMMIKPAFERVKQPLRLLLILDQMEELWTDSNITDEDREVFLNAVLALARSGYVSVLATLRSDFYSYAQKSVTFLALKGERGHYDLLPPDGAAIQRLITEPARLAGVKFERNEGAGKSVAEKIWEDASNDSDALPLLEYTLSELYRTREREKDLITFAAYEKLGGVEGAIGKRASEMFDQLHNGAKLAFEEVLPLLVSVDTSGEMLAVRRRAAMSTLTSTTGRVELTQALIENRFLATDREGDVAVASLSHEALLRSWKEIVGWIQKNREQLRRRARVEQLQHRWEQQDRDSSLLLFEGLALDEGRNLLDEASELLSDSTIEYIQASIESHEQRKYRSVKNRVVSFSAIAALLVFMVAGVIFLKTSNDRDRARNKVFNQLRKPESGALPLIVENLSELNLPHKELIDVFFDQKNEEHSKEKRLGFGLVLLSRSHTTPEILAELSKLLVQLHPKFFVAIKEKLQSHEERLIVHIAAFCDDFSSHKGTNDREQQRQKAHAMCILACMNQSENVLRKKECVELLIAHMSEQNNEHQETWLANLDPPQDESDPLVSSLEQFLLDVSGDVELSQVEFVARALKQLVPHARLKALGDELYERITGYHIAGKFNDPKKIALARRYALIATVLVHKKPEPVMTGLTADEMDLETVMKVLTADEWDLETMTQFVHHFKSWSEKFEIDVHEFADAAFSESEKLDQDPQTQASFLYGLLLTLGEFDSGELKESWFGDCVKKLEKLYQDHGDAGVHSATGWLLRRWNKAALLEIVDADESGKYSYKESKGVREWFVQNFTIDGETFHQTYVVIPAGLYEIGLDEEQMSDSPSDGGGDSHEVNLTRSFAVLDREVTQREYEAFCKSPGETDHDPRLHSGSDSSAMVGPSWYDSVAFCRWWSMKTNVDDAYFDTDSKVDTPEPRFDFPGFRLPTEREWEIAARAKTKTMFSFGGDESLLKHYGWYAGNSKIVSPAYQLRPNKNGLFDIHGNTFEWCQCWLTPYDTSKNAEEPVNRAVVSDSDRVHRGGCWEFRLYYCQSACRYGHHPDDKGTDNGLRLVYTVKQ
jgi:formylglycine-generating enzyme required for sulfatase activity